MNVYLKKMISYLQVEEEPLEPSQSQLSTSQAGTGSKYIQPSLEQLAPFQQIGGIFGISW